MKNKELIIFDVDNTLVSLQKPHNYIWDIFNTHFETVNEDYELYKKWKSEEISYRDWVTADLELYQSKGGNRESFYDVLTKLTSICPRTHDLLRILKKRKKKLGVVSGSIDILLEIHGLIDYFDRIHLNRVPFCKQGYVDFDGVYDTPFDNEHKVHGVEEICDYLSMGVNNSIYIGDGDNDIPVAEYVNNMGGISISFNGSEKLQKVSTHCYNGSLGGLSSLLL